MLINSNLIINEKELKFSFIRAPGPGGQNVNKVATAVQLRFNVTHSASLPEAIRARLLVLAASKITQHGDLIFKASRYRTQERNKQDALQRLQQLIQRAAVVPKKRKKTKPTKSSVQKRLTTKKLHAKSKALRNKKLDQFSN